MATSLCINTISSLELEHKVNTSKQANRDYKWKRLTCALPRRCRSMIIIIIIIHHHQIFRAIDKDSVQPNSSPLTATTAIFSFSINALLLGAMVFRVEQHNKRVCTHIRKTRAHRHARALSLHPTYSLAHSLSLR